MRRAETEDEMNCKPGDMAFIVRSMAGNEGKIVTCVRLATLKELNNYNFRLDLGPVWVIDRFIRCSHGVMAPLALDARMRPIPPLDEPVTIDEEMTA